MRTSSIFAKPNKIFKTLYMGIVILGLVSGSLGTAGRADAAEPGPGQYACLGAPADEPNGGIYPEPRIFLENQAWWQPTISGTENFGHIHSGACVPRTHYPDGTEVKISGTLQIPIRTMLHDNPGLLRYSRIHLTTSASNHSEAYHGDINEYCVENGPRWVAASKGCVWWSMASVDTTISEYDGFQELRVSGNVRHNGAQDTMFSSGGWQVYLNNGKPVNHYRNTQGAAKDFTEARGWYVGANYINAGLESRIPYEVSGTWKPFVRMVAGANGITPTRGFVSVDPNFHFGNEGTVVYSGAAPYRGEINIDTTTLSDGMHKLFIRTDAPCDGAPGRNCGLKADGTSNNVSTLSGGLLVPFLVHNNVIPDTMAPTIELTAPADAAVVSGAVDLTSKATDDVKVAKVEFLVAGTVIGSDSVSPYAFNWDTRNVANGQYTVQAKAYDAAGNATSSNISTVSVQNADSNAPRSLTATSPASGQVNLSWQSGPDGANASGYRLYRGGALIGTSQLTTYNDTAVQPSTSYSYVVTAIFPDGTESIPSNTATVITAAPPKDTTAPTAPSNLRITLNQATRVDIAWNQSTDAVGVTNYLVFRNGTKIATVSAATLVYSDKTAKAQTAYTYTVKARDAAGNVSVASNTAKR